jgi:hypothetical protein
MKVLKNETSMTSESEIYNNQGSRRQRKGRSGKVSKTGELRRAGLNPRGKGRRREGYHKKVKKKRRVRGGEERSRSRRAKRKEEGE